MQPNECLEPLRIARQFLNGLMNGSLGVDCPEPILLAPSLYLYVYDSPSLTGIASWIGTVSVLDGYVYDIRPTESMPYTEEVLRDPDVFKRFPAVRIHSLSGESCVSVKWGSSSFAKFFIKESDGRLEVARKVFFSS